MNNTDDWIDLGVYEELIDDLEVGDTVRVDHFECPAGQDTKRRLYLTKPAHAPKTVLAYCHNCNGKGVQTGQQGYRTNAHSYWADPPPKIVEGEFKPPPNLITDPALWPTHATQWRIEKNLTQVECQQYGIAHDGHSNHVYLPMWAMVDIQTSHMQHPSMVLHGYQLRRLVGKGPKYTTVLKDKGTIPSTTIRHKVGNDTVILVEDLASGIAIAGEMDDDVAVMVNYGVKNTPQVLDRASTKMKQGIVWLDNDNDHVKEQARGIARTWSLIRGCPVAVVSDYADPKLVELDTIGEVIRKYKHVNV